MQPSQPAATSVQVTVPGFKFKMVEKNVCFYEVVVNSRDGKKWELEKRFKDFDTLHQALKRVFSNIPDLPSKSLWTLSEAAQIERRREQLEKYMQLLVGRPDILNSEVMRMFLQIENFAPDAVVNPPKLLQEISSFVLGVRDFKYEVEKGLLFVGISDMNPASRIDSYLTNMKLPWEKDLNITIVTVGALECYVQTDASEYKFDKLWTKTFPSQVICLDWESKSCRIAVGMDDGKVEIMTVASELNYMKFNEVLNAKIHAARVMGVYIDNIKGFLYLSLIHI
eukprot:TRINITY_DN3344_c0_g1_i5.p1 TRINITY_DN3344_c0_g1~~TRINITY_DN3344_c0_g1_i5.p1  ORF type:complete len:282 (-),score=74.70 TRINITY_DN3344_c0_g1_i5:62-907(-)